MANNIDQLNYYDPLIKGKQDKMSEVWIANMSAFIQTLQGYLTQFGILVPQLTTSQRNSIQSPVNGQIIYNTTLNKFQGWENGAWVNIA
jgi:hypothetical protein